MTLNANVYYYPARLVSSRMEAALPLSPVKTGYVQNISRNTQTNDFKKGAPLVGKSFIADDLSQKKVFAYSECVLY